MGRGANSRVGSHRPPLAPQVDAKTVVSAMRLDITAFTRRIGVTALSFLFAAALIAPAPTRASAEGSPAEAAEFIERLGLEAVDELSRDDVPDAQRRAQFLDLLERGFAVEAISRFVLGRYWRVASTEQREQFQDVFKRIVAQRFLPVFKDYGREEFVVNGADPDPTQPSLYAVRTLIARPGQTGGDAPKFQVIWRVRPAGDSYEIVDIKAEGGNVGTLIADLEDKLAKGAYAPEESADAMP